MKGPPLYLRASIGQSSWEKEGSLHHKLRVELLLLLAPDLCQAGAWSSPQQLPVQGSGEVL
jgi:hypothetical protein